MSKSLFDVVIENISEFSVTELTTLQRAIDTYLGGDDLKIQALKIKQESGTLCALKFIKDRTGWGLKESKEFCDNLE